MRCFVHLIYLLPFFLWSQEEIDADLSLEEIMQRNIVDMSIEDWVNLDEKGINELSFYGFLNFNAEKVVSKPIEQVAIKFDGSVQTFDFNGQRENYAEIRVDVSYMFK